ncbi:MAG: DUF2867 domain-containing protein [Acidimicrobiia bacterium]|nr:DUF2867 domain-containing protein [Acidimicrobiia bacterium]
MKVLVTGATGYIGGRLVHRLLEDGFDVRCMTRDPERLQLDPWRDRVEVVKADALVPETLDEALAGCDTAFFLIHAMGPGNTEFPALDRRAATNFAAAAERAGLRRIVYLGGLGEETDVLSKHLASRREVGQILATGATPVTALRAAVIIGSGSVSFEMIRHLTEILPVIMRPDWMRSRCQPIAVRNVVEILVSVIDDPEPVNREYDIGGPDVLTYEEMMQGYAKVAGLRKRVVVPLPIFSARLSALVVGLGTPLPKAIAGPLIGSLLNDVVVRQESPPGFEPETLLSYEAAVARALDRISHAEVETRWSDAVTSPAAPIPSDPVWSGAHMKANEQTVSSTASTADLFWAVSRIGGDVGYYAMNPAWVLRGWFDQLIGGVGRRRGRRDPEELRLGEAVDFFRVVEVRPESGKLLLQAEMKTPGTAWLGWSIEEAPGGSRLTQSARFVPRGLLGRLYWYSLLPAHSRVFKRMAKKIAATAEQRGVR